MPEKKDPVKEALEALIGKSLAIDMIISVTGNSRFNVLTVNCADHEVKLSVSLMVDSDTDPVVLAIQFFDTISNHLKTKVK
jgi:hypothetical protein